MTTDITELAQRMKAAAGKATQGEWRRASTQFNGITATPFMLGRKEVIIAGASEKRDAEFIALANPANILALVEALEKAQQHIARQEQILLNQDESLSIRRGEMEAAHQRIAELESRTVKLPKPHAHLIWIQAGHAPDDYWDDVEVSHSEKDRCCDGSERYPAYSIFEIQEACVAAGVKLVQSDEPFSLKSRAVKLPKTMYTEFDNDDYCREVAVLDKQQVIDALTAAGIKVEAE